MSQTLIIVIVTVLVSINAFNNQKVFSDLMFYPPAVSERGQWWRFITCGFVHADVMHLAFNMIALYSFGEGIERKMNIDFGRAGNYLYIAMYIIALVVCLLPTYAKHKHNQAYSSVGASGAVSAVVFAGLLIYPLSSVRFMFIPIDIPGFVFGPAYLIISTILDKKGGGNVNHSAHIWGAIFGMVFITACSFILTNRNILVDFITQVKNYVGM
jgi:membrane associated rhomboid family serine protease